MKAQLVTHLYLRSNRPDKLGNLPIYVRFTLANKRKEFSTKIFITPKTWDDKLYKVKGNNQEAYVINSQLENIRLKANQTFIALTYKGDHITIDEFFEAFTGESKDKVRTIVPIFQEHNKRLYSLIDKDYAYGTYERYQTALNHLIKFMQYQYGVNDFPIHKLNHAFVTDFDFYLRTECNCKNNTTVKYVKNVKKIINICIANGWLDKDPFSNYKIKLEDVDRKYLTQYELEQLLNKDLHTSRLDQVRDMFIFSCFTGLAFIDVKKLTYDKIIKGIDGKLWIDTNREKTKIESKIPLLETPLKILKKYEDHPYTIRTGHVLPLISNQKTNAYLKEIAVLCGINKNLTYHCARHTFATTITLSNGVPIESVSKMLGHKSIRTTQHYAKITDTKISNDMSNLENILERKITKSKNIG